MGGLYKCAHLVEELQRPLFISQEEISKDLVRFVHGFPIDAIPYETDNEKKIKKTRRDITRIRVDKLHLDQARDQGKIDAGEHLRRATQLNMKESFWHTQLK